MPSAPIHTTVSGRSLKLTNPDKILFPALGIVKAEIIKYYLEMADQMLPLIGHRPLTLIRYPDGINGKKFYSKNKPNWTPEWIASTLFLDDDENQYIMANEAATLVWIGNLAGLEIHPMNVRSPNLQYPDQFVFDLDPSSEVDFPALKKLAFNLKIFLEEYGYTPFIKTSGGKGLHIYVPILPQNTIDEVYTSVKNLASDYIRNKDKNTTLKISKAQRKGKVLLDIYRNSKAQSCVAPFSLRAKPGAPVSTPFSWDLLESVKHSQQWTIYNLQDHLQKHGNAWDKFTQAAAPLHDKQKRSSSSLTVYTHKRDFAKTKEPTAKEKIKTSGRDYVVQLHDANNLHYDLRLEENGVLLSWAIPKGIPDQPGIKRLAIKTEDHPLKYLRFEGNIPKEEYGGGEMWIFDSGQYSILKKSEKKYHFVLEKGGLSGEYVLYHTRDKQWIIERKENRSLDINTILQPMLASMGKGLPSSEDYFYEIKWDGIRVIVVLDKENLFIYSRNGNDITRQFPQLSVITDQIEAESAVLDGEIVHLDEQGKPLFHKIVGRIHVKGEKQIEQKSRSTPAVLYLFDLLYLDGKDCRSENNIRRREWLRTILTIHDKVRFSESFEDGQHLFNAIEAQGMEGIICKKKTGKYINGKRSNVWKKIKVRHEDKAYIIGYTAGEGDRNGMIGALHLGKKIEHNWQYMGKVGTGFDHEMLEEITHKMHALSSIQKPIKEKIEEASRTTWVQAVYLCDVNFASLSSNGTYREPVFQRMYHTNE